jgi:hypothetical protein
MYFSTLTDLVYKAILPAGGFYKTPFPECSLF